jgi:hypothetical protein
MADEFRLGRVSNAKLTVTSQKIKRGLQPLTLKPLLVPVYWSVRRPRRVEGLSDARARMLDIAAQIPGKYFVYSGMSHAIVAQTETDGAN